MISTRKLVDSIEEHALLEEIIDRAKPPVSPELARLHYLLYTPFRYPPLEYGSRFGVRHERGLWYGALEVRTALAEASYHRLLFLEGTKAALAPLTLAMTVFRAAVKAGRGVDLSRPPFAAHERRIASPSTYEHAQRLGARMRGAGVEAFLYVSARDRARGKNAALLAPVFARRAPTAGHTWHCVAEKARIEFRHAISREQVSFARGEFLVAGKLPAPGLPST